MALPMMTDEELSVCITAAQASKFIEWMARLIPGGKWRLKEFPQWDTERHIYRVKPEPRRIFINEYRGGQGTHLSGEHYSDASDAREAASMSLVRTVEFVEVME